MAKKIYNHQYERPNILIEPTAILFHPLSSEEPKVDSNYFGKYESPNILIVPSDNICEPSPKRIKLDNTLQNQSPEDVDISFLDDFNIDEIVACLNNCDNMQQHTKTGTYCKISQTFLSETTKSINLNKEDLNNKELEIKSDVHIVDIGGNCLKSLTSHCEIVEEIDLTQDGLAKELQIKSDVEIVNIDESCSKYETSPCETIEEIDFSKEGLTNKLIDVKIVNAVENCLKCQKYPSETFKKVESTHDEPIEIKTNIIDLEKVENCLQSLENEKNVKKFIKNDEKVETYTESSNITLKEKLETEFRMDNTLEKSINNTEVNFESTKGQSSIVSFKFVNETNEKKKLNFEKDLKDYQDNCLTTKANIDLAEDNLDSKTCLKTEIKTETTSINAASALIDNNSMKIESQINRDIISKKESKPLIEFNMPDNKNEKPETKSDDIKKSVQNKMYNATLPKSIIQCNADVLQLENLEQRMFEYLHEKFSVLSIIHYGKYSKIFKCKDSTGNDYVVKMLNDEADRFTRGIDKENMLQKVQHDIPKENLFCTYLLNSFSLNRHWCFLMEFYPKDLKQVLKESAKPFKIHVIQYFAKQLVAAVTLLRNNNIVHSDIKPNHILINSTTDRLKLCGFDNAFYKGPDNNIPKFGALNYRPPELILGHSAGFGLDVWSTALVLCEMAIGTKLFPGCSHNDMLYRQMSVLGNVPRQMIYESVYSDQYFVGSKFIRKIGFKKKVIVLIENFGEEDGLRKLIYKAYVKHWGPGVKKPGEDRNKLFLFTNLLKKMLVLYPKQRLPIEFVYANPFICDSISN